MYTAHRHAVAHGKCDHVGQVELALRVVVVQRLHPVTQAPGGRSEKAAVDLPDAALPGSGVLLLDDGADVAAVILEDAAIAGGIVQRGGQHGQITGRGDSEQLLQRVR